MLAPCHDCGLSGRCRCQVAGSVIRHCSGCGAAGGFGDRYDPPDWLCGRCWLLWLGLVRAQPKAVYR